MRPAGLAGRLTMLPVRPPTRPIFSVFRPPSTDATRLPQEDKIKVGEGRAESFIINKLRRWADARDDLEVRTF